MNRLIVGLLMMTTACTSVVEVPPQDFESEDERRARICDERYGGSWENTVVQQYDRETDSLVSVSRMMCVVRDGTRTWVYPIP